MQVRGLFLLCTLAIFTAGAAGHRADEPGGRGDHYRNFLGQVEGLHCAPPQSAAGIRAAAERLVSYHSQSLVRNFILHSATRMAESGLPRLAQPGSQASLPASLEDTIGEIARLHMLLGGLGGRMMALARERAVPAQPSPRGPDSVQPAARPSERGVLLFLRITETARQIERGRAPAVEGGEELERCLRLAQLNLHQCLAAAHFEREEIFCAARHGFTETGECWGNYVNFGPGNPQP